MEEDLTPQMRAEWGDEQTEEYIALAKAMRSLIHLWWMFVKAPIGSPEEGAFAAAIQKMQESLVDHPDHAASMVEGLVALVLHLRMDGRFEDWFEAMGIAAVPNGVEKLDFP